VAKKFRTLTLGDRVAKKFRTLTLGDRVAKKFRTLTLGDRVAKNIILTNFSIVRKSNVKIKNRFLNRLLLVIGIKSKK
jgi:hypothetical protein